MKIDNGRVELLDRRIEEVVCYIVGEIAIVYVRGVYTKA